jgi:stearoyl-CoA 9-desaturase NADPH oxidoreductase
MESVVAPSSGASGRMRRESGWGRALRDRAVKLAEAATTPYEPSDFLDLFHPLRSGADLRARIVSVQPETADAATIVLQPGADWAGHIPGQFIRIGIDVNGVRQWRAYSLTHGPRADGLISITVKAVRGGIVSTHLVHGAKAGTMVHLEQAAGEFVLPADIAGHKMLFVTAGSGITPVVGMLRNLFPVTDEGVLDLPRSRGLDITVVHLARTETESIFIDHLRALNAAGAIRLIARMDDVHGVLNVDYLDGLVPDLAERTTYACGPPGLIAGLREHHEARELPLYVEQFQLAEVIPAEGGTITFTGSGRTLEAAGDRPILDVAEDSGVLMPSGCRMGICMGCVLPMTEGAVRDLRNGELTIARPGETATGGVKVQTCISAAAGACSFTH